MIKDMVHGLFQIVTVKPAFFRVKEYPFCHRVPTYLFSARWMTAIPRVSLLWVTRENPTLLSISVSSEWIPKLYKVFMKSYLWAMRS